MRHVTSLLRHGTCSHKFRLSVYGIRNDIVHNVSENLVGHSASCRPSTPSKLSEQCDCSPQTPTGTTTKNVHHLAKMRCTNDSTAQIKRLKKLELTHHVIELRLSPPASCVDIIAVGLLGAMSFHWPTVSCGILVSMPSWKTPITASSRVPSLLNFSDASMAAELADLRQTASHGVHGIMG